MGGKFKGFDSQGSEAIVQVEQALPLFPDQPFDPQSEGGLLTCVVTRADGSTGSIIGQVYAPDWAHDGNRDLVDRLSSLPLHVVTDGGRTYIVRDKPKHAWDPTAPDLGGESERHTDVDGTPHRITVNGRELLYPDGSRELFQDTKSPHLDPEGLGWTVEFGIPVAIGYEAYNVAVRGVTVMFEQWLTLHDLTSPCLSVFPDRVKQGQTTQISYVQCIAAHMPSLTEFAGQGEQIHVPLKNHASGVHALAMYQGIQWLPELATASAPLRDGSFNTTLFEHYNENYRARDGAPILPEDDYLRYLYRRSTADQVPYDWRYLSRVYGSEEAGAHSHVLPADFQQYLREADVALRSHNAPITIDRILGPHADRYRLGLNTGELSNMGTSGGNLRKKLAVDELVIKYFIAEQVWYDKLATEKPPGWEEEVAERQRRSIEIGHYNNIFVSVSGKSTNFLTPRMPSSKASKYPEVASRGVILSDIIAFTNSQLRGFGVPVTEASEREIRATLADPPDITEFVSAEEVFEYFFSPESRLTATEALRYGHKLSTNMTAHELLGLYGRMRRTQLYALCGHVDITASLAQ
jgi:hypothetical protein